MTEPPWLEREWVDALHFQQLKRFGGLYGTREPGAIDSALARPRNLWEYAEERDPARLAASYGFGLARSHGYSDGNKRVAFVAMAVFLDLNGWSLEAPESETVQIMRGVAAGDLSEEELSTWLGAHLQPAEPT